MYTEFIFGCTLSKNTPKQCIDALDYVINGQEEKERFNRLKMKTSITRTTSIKEIEEFIDKYEHNIFAYVQYEEAPSPTLYGKDGRFDVMDPKTEKELINKENVRWKMINNLLSYAAPYYYITETELEKYGIKPNGDVELDEETRIKMICNYITRRDNKLFYSIKLCKKHKYRNH